MSKIEYNTHLNYKEGELERVDPSYFIPLHNVREQEKLKKISSSMEREGYKGRPVLVMNEDSNEGINVLTGTHRIAAAKENNIEVPIYRVQLEPEEIEEMMGARDDEDRLYILENAKEPDLYAISLMKKEILGENYPINHGSPYPGYHWVKAHKRGYIEVRGHYAKDPNKRRF